MKAKLQSLEYFIDNQDNLSAGVDIGMLRYAGKEVTITDVDVDDDESLSIQEDGGDYNWSPDMFISLPKELELRKLDLAYDLDGNDCATFDSNGNMKVGCQEVDFKMLEGMYNRAVQIRALRPKPKKRKATKKKKKASKR